MLVQASIEAISKDKHNQRYTVEVDCRWRTFSSFLLILEKKNDQNVRNKERSWIYLALIITSWELYPYSSFRHH